MVKKTQSKSNTFKKVLISLGIGAMISAVVWLVLDRRAVHNMVCQIVAVDEQEGIVAVRCLAK